MHLFQKIEEISLQYNSANRNIGEFVLREKNKLHNYTIQQIADLTYTSKPTVVRFAKALGFSGWKEFIKAFVKESHYEMNHYSDISPNFPFESTDSVTELINKLSKLQVESILDTAALIKADVLERAVDMLISARHIVMFGMSPNIYISDLFRRKMRTIGSLIHVPLTEESGVAARSLTNLDCAIIISYSGNNKDREPMRFIESLKENNVSIIGITSAEENYLRTELDCVLTISSHERLYSKIAGFATEESIMHILNILYSCYFARNYHQNLNYKIKNSKEFEYRRTAFLNNMKENLSD